MKKASVILLSSVLATAIFSTALTGCGQKGPLYLPQPEKPAAPKSDKAKGQQSSSKVSSKAKVNSSVAPTQSELPSTPDDLQTKDASQ